jgi:hypothetical protein
MTTSQHPKTRTPNDKDLKINPGIGQSKGLNRFTGDDDIAGDATEEGDVSNDVNRYGGISPEHRGRTNK